MKPWKYENLMEFLLPHRENNETFSNFSNPTQGHDTENTSDTIITDIDIVGSPPPPAEYSLSTTSTIQSGKKNSKQLEITEIIQRREKNREQRRAERDEIRKHITDANRPQDALSHLFESFCQKTRDLPKYLQLRVQREIFETITRAEEEALSYDSMNTYYSSTPSNSSSYGYRSATNYQTSPLLDASPLPDCNPLPDVRPVLDASPLPGCSPLPDVRPVSDANPLPQPQDTFPAV